MRYLYTLIAAFLLAGCASTSSIVQDDGSTLPVPVLTNSVEVASLHVGVLSTGKYLAYGNKTLLCPGADADMWAMHRLMLAAGYTNSVTLLSQAATWANIKDTARRLTVGFGPEDWLFITQASHGGRTADTNGDEPSGYDSTLCFYDGPIVDDAVWAFICTLPPCRILLITDCCYAAGNFRWYQRRTPVALVSRTGGWAGSLVQLSACRADESALGNKVGGQWTSALEYVHPAPTLQKWFDWAAAECSDQTPTLVTYGPLAKQMLEGEPFK